MLTLSSTLSSTADTALFGHDLTTHLVAVQPLPASGETGHATMRVYQRQETGAGLRTEDVPCYPFFFLTDIRLLHGFPRDKFRCKTLQG
ncbi:MAG TPA: DNA polymerase, partial [Candidatus Tectomicrobia bacterium]